MTVYDYLRLFRRGWLVIVATTLLGIGLGGLVTILSTPSFTVRATLVVSALGDSTPGGLQQSNDFAVQRASTYAGLASTDAVLSRAASATGDDVDDLRSSIFSTVREGTSLIDVDAQGSDPALTTARANAVAGALAEEAVLLDAPSAQSPVQLTQVTQAEEPTNPTTPRPRNNVLIGAVVGLVLGIGLVVVGHALDDRIRTVNELPRSAALATATSLPVARTRRTRGGSGLDARLESFRNLRANLQFGARAGRTIAVAGVTADTHVHDVTHQLAVVLGEIGVDVVVVDVDLRPHRSRRDATGEIAPGVADVLEGLATPAEVLTTSGSAGVSHIPAGRVGGSTSQRVGTSAMQELLDELGRSFDYVLLAAPALVDRSESVVAAALAGSSLLVVESGATKKSELLHALELLHGVGVSSVSLAVDNVRGQEPGSTTSGSAPTGAGA